MTDREALGRRVREVWLAWARAEYPDAVPESPDSVDLITNSDLELCRRIGETIARETRDRIVARLRAQVLYEQGSQNYRWDTASVLRELAAEIEREGGR